MEFKLEPVQQMVLGAEDGLNTINLCCPVDGTWLGFLPHEQQAIGTASGDGAWSKDHRSHWQHSHGSQWALRSGHGTFRCVQGLQETQLERLHSVPHSVCDLGQVCLFDSTAAQHDIAFSCQISSPTVPDTQLPIPPAPLAPAPVQLGVNSTVKDSHFWHSAQ